MKHYFYFSVIVVLRSRSPLSEVFRTLFYHSPERFSDLPPLRSSFRKEERKRPWINERESRMETTLEPILEARSWRLDVLLLLQT